MNPTLIYFIKVNIAIALFYLFYRLFFAYDTFWKTRRAYLVFSIVMSFAYPVFSIIEWLQDKEPMQALVSGYVQMQEFTVTPEITTIFTWENILLAIYVLVTSGLLIRLFVQLISILNIHLRNKTTIINNEKVIVVNKNITPFSFFGNIYLNPSLHNKEELNQILIHELTHVRQLHSIDVLLSELVCITFWFNPATWLLKREIRQNLEFLADNKVLSSGFDSKSYQYHLVQLSFQTPNYRLTNSFNILPLKKRIIMMNQQKSRKSSALKYLMIVPLSFSLVLLSNAETIAKSVSDSLQNNKKSTVLSEVSVTSYGVSNTKTQDSVAVKPELVIISKTIKKGKGTTAARSQKTDDEPFTVVETMPKFPGGEQALFKFLNMNVSYPIAAQEKGAQGQVICQFVIASDGSVEDVSVVRGVEASLDAEAVRVIKAMPKWSPGMQKGKAVRVKYTLPVNFKLKNNDKNAELKEMDYSDIKNMPLDKRPILVVNKKIVSFEEFSKYKPESIESITVLKDKAAIEVWGKKGKNGVISIKLK